MQAADGAQHRDLAGGVRSEELAEGGMLRGELNGEPVLLVRWQGRAYAIGAVCTHYSGPLEEGLVADGAVHCPWHHACFRLADGAASAPALADVASWEVRESDGRVELGAKRLSREVSGVASGPGVMAIIGAGAAGSSAADTLRREGYTGRILLIDPDAAAPYDRPNLSKDYLAGSAPAKWLPLRDAATYRSLGIERVQARVTGIDAGAKRLMLADGQEVSYDALLLATGATPVRPPVPGAELEHVHVLRSLADCERLIAGVHAGAALVIAGASFIGLEAAAALRARGASVTVVAPESVPFERTLGPSLGRFLQRTHESHGVRFRLGRTLADIGRDQVVLDDGERLRADLVLLGVGVRPDLALAQAAGVAVDQGVLVDERLETTVPGVYAAGDIAAWLDARTGERRRVEHWVVAQRQGAHAARSMLGARAAFRDVPFFWTQQYDVAIAYSGYARSWDREEVSGSPEEHDCAVRYYRSGQVVALATIGRDRENLAFGVAAAESRLSSDE